MIDHRRITGGATFPRPNIGSEALWAPRYDYQHVESVLAYQSFFTHPVGCDTPRGPKTARDTNMTSGNMLPQGNSFLVTGIRVLFIPDCVLHRGRKEEDEQDARRMLLGGELRFQIANRDYVRDGPLAKFPSLLPKTWMGELAYMAPDAEEAHWQAIYDPALQRIGKLSAYAITPLFIQQNQFFCVNIAHEPGRLNAPAKLGVILDGQIVRAYY